MKQFRNWIEAALNKRLAIMQPVSVGYRHGRKVYALFFEDGTNNDYFIDFDNQIIEGV